MHQSDVTPKLLAAIETECGPARTWHVVEPARLVAAVVSEWERVQAVERRKARRKRTTYVCPGCGGRRTLADTPGPKWCDCNQEKPFVMVPVVYRPLR